MKRLLWIAPYLGLMLTGCDTTILVASGKKFSEYQKSIKAYGEYWVKEGMTVEQWREDWVACGGKEDGTFSWDVRKKMPGESDDAARTRLNSEFQRCMLRRGYRYTGDCSSEYMKALPLCGAP
jgi:hypothetical protein